MINNKTIIDNISPDDLTMALTAMTIEYALSTGQNINDNERNFIVQKITNRITDKPYSGWTLYMISNVFKIALEDHESKVYKLTVRNFYIWLAKARAIYMSKKHQDIPDVQDMTNEQREDSRWYAYAVHKSINNRLKGFKLSDSIHGDVMELRIKYNNDLSLLPKITPLNFEKEFEI